MRVRYREEDGMVATDACHVDQGQRLISGDDDKHQKLTDNCLPRDECVHKDE